MSPNTSFSSSSSSSRHGTSSAANGATSSASASGKKKRGSSVAPNSHASNTHARRLRSAGQWQGSEHHPFRLEVQKVTPVSISFLWSVRPPPISEYRAPLAGPTQSKDAGTDSQGAAPLAATTGSSTERKADTAQQQHCSTNAATSDLDVATEVDGSEGKDDVSEAGASDLATTSNKTSEPVQVQQSQISPSASSSIPQPSRASTTFEAGMSVAVNGQTWSHVVLCDQGADEAVVVVYGLLPGKKYDLDLSVGSEDSELAAAKPANFSARITTGQQADSASGSESTGFATPERRDSAVALGHKLPHGSNAGSLPASENGHLNSDQQAEASTAHQHLAQITQAEARRDSLAATLRQNRKDASRAEQGIRNEIEAIKKTLERLSSNDHRAKQKVLALQESIRQANQQAADHIAEAETIEAEQDEWDVKAKDATAEEEREREVVEGEEAQNKEVVEADRHLTTEQEKARAATKKHLDAKRAEVEKLKSGKLAELEAEIAKLQAETERVRNSSTPPPAPALHQSTSATWTRGGALEPNAPAFHPGASGYRSVSGPPGAPRGQQYRERGGRGGKAGPHARNNPGHFHRRGRGAAGSGASSGSHQGHFVVPQAAAGSTPTSASSHMGFLPSQGPGPSDGSGYYAQQQQSNQGLSPFLPSTQGLPGGDPYHNPSPLISGSSASFGPPEPHQQHALLPSLNTKMTDYISPSSASASPVISKSRNISPIPPSGAAGGSAVSAAAAWGAPAADFSPQFSHHDPSAVGQSRYAFGRGLPKVTTSSNSPTLHHHQSHGSLFGFPAATNQVGARRDSPTNALFGTHGPSLLGGSDHLSRRGSYNPVDFRDDDAFDPTAGPLPSKTFLAAHDPHGPSPSSRTAFNSSPWSPRSVVGTSDLSGGGAGGSGPHSASSAFALGGPPNAAPSSPWAQSSPLLDSFHHSSGSSSAPPAPTDAEIWSPNGASSSRALRGPPPSGGAPGSSTSYLTHHRQSPSLLSNGGGFIGQQQPPFAPHRNNSGSSGSNHSASSGTGAGAAGIGFVGGSGGGGGGGGGNGGSGSLPTSPTSSSSGAGAVGPIGQRTTAAAGPASSAGASNVSPFVYF